jgi:hypothetical protein
MHTGGVLADIPEVVLAKNIDVNVRINKKKISNEVFSPSSHSSAQYHASLIIQRAVKGRALKRARKNIQLRKSLAMEDKTK